MMKFTTYLENYTLNVLNALYNFSILLIIIYVRPSENNYIDSSYNNVMK